MSAKVKIQPSGHEFVVNDDETILEAALREHYVLPYGCRNGACGACKGKVVDGTVDMGKFAESSLTPEERGRRHGSVLLRQTNFGFDYRVQGNWRGA